MKWYSWSSHRSFWIEKLYLLQTLQDFGFDTVFEQFDCEPNIVGQYRDGFTATNSRAMFVAVKQGGLA